MRETAAVASARAAEIYGLNVIADRIQVKFLHLLLLNLPLYLALDVVLIPPADVTFDLLSKFLAWQLFIIVE